jgi:hypothetical protein
MRRTYKFDSFDACFSTATVKSNNSQFSTIGQLNSRSEMDGNAFSTDLEVTDLEDPDEEGWLTVNHHENNSTPQLTHGGTQSLAMEETENAVQRQLEYYMDLDGARVAYVVSHENVTTFRRPAISQLDIPETGKENTSSLSPVESDFTEDDNALDYSIISLSSLSLVESDFTKDDNALDHSIISLSSLSPVESDFTEDDNALDYSIISPSPEMDPSRSAPRSPFVIVTMTDEFRVEFRDELSGGNNSEENEKDEEREDKLNRNEALCSFVKERRL